MTFWRRLIGGVALLGLAIPIAAFAQTQEQEVRLDTLARYTVTSPVCERLGMTVVPEAGARIEEAIWAEAASWGMTRATFDIVSGAAVRRQLRILEVDTEPMIRNASGASGPRDLRAWFARLGATCLAAAADPLFSRFLSVPAGFDLQRAATAAADESLDDTGDASWQTPAIQARGDLLAIAGACRHHIGPARSDRLFETYSRSDHPRERAYYVSSFDYGLNDASLQNLDATQCERAIRRLTARATAAED